MSRITDGTDLDDYLDWLFEDEDDVDQRGGCEDDISDIFSS